MKTIVPNTIPSVGSIVKFKKLSIPPLPTTVIKTSATARAIVPASVERNPQLNIPLERRGDIILASNDISTPAQVIYISAMNHVLGIHILAWGTSNFQIPSRTFVAIKIIKAAMIYCASVYGNIGEYDNIPRTPIAVKIIVQRRICLEMELCKRAY